MGHNEKRPRDGGTSGVRHQELRSKVHHDPTDNTTQGNTRPGRGFPVDEAARLLAAGVYLPDYPADLIAEAWRCNYVAAVEEHRAFVDGLTEALNAHGVPAMPSWREAIDYLAARGGMRA